jgi:hypothetical protein
MHLKHDSMNFSKLHKLYKLDSSLAALRMHAPIGYSHGLGRSGQRGAHRIPVRACA